ncbi:class I SAM-dependent methyltransferase [Archangium sp.]|uniref:class I SAM-dependent methyltransferase n=1 Tax=Archangium sp. TaxID=1872627 RepID=UPI002D712537|nr:methyltransferase domain-containing protein [Archangium sp.]HYO56774.1 methyltransferase domain-containing protein [Archangium sp.]
MSYVLESKSEFDRLEHQSGLSGYDYQRELALAGLSSLQEGMRLLDAGCGSGVLARHLAHKHSGCAVVGCDISETRVRQARDAARDLPNLHFELGDLTRLDYPEGHFDVIICRYVLQHLPQEIRPAALASILRCLKPGGRLIAIDFDGGFLNLHPQPSSWLQEALRSLETRFPVDLRIGRKLPHLLVLAGFSEISWRIDVLEWRDELLAQERMLMDERILALEPVLAAVLGGTPEAQRFRTEYLAALDTPGSVLFYNKFIVTGRKPSRQGFGIP